MTIKYNICHLVIKFVCKLNIFRMFNISTLQFNSIHCPKQSKESENKNSIDNVWVII